MGDLIVTNRLDSQCNTIITPVVVLNIEETSTQVERATTENHDILVARPGQHM